LGSWVWDSDFGFGRETQKESRPGTASWEPSRLGLGGEADTHTNDGFWESEQRKSNAEAWTSKAAFGASTLGWYAVCSGPEYAHFLGCLLSSGDDSVF
jgi:hypothetical protein